MASSSANKVSYIVAPYGHQSSSLRKFPKPLRTSTPDLTLNSDRHLLDVTIMKTNGDGYKVPYSRSFTGQTSSGYSKIGLGHATDAKNIQPFIHRRDSRTSLFSSASAGLVASDNASSASSTHSRPVSADNNSNIAQSTTISIAPSSATNTRLVLPNPSLPRHVPLNRSSSIPSLVNRRQESYVDKLVCRVYDYLYMGDIEAAYNANLLCRLNIGYVIDISNVEAHKVPRNKRSDCPCLCSAQTAHSRARMTITIDEDSQLDLTTYFDGINRFIDSARTCNKSVLIHSYNGRTRCAVLVVQYLMASRKLTLEMALQTLKGIRPDVIISDNFIKSLKKWESIVQQKRANDNDQGDAPKLAMGVPIIGQYDNLARGVPTMKRSAWV